MFPTSRGHPNLDGIERRIYGDSVPPTDAFLSGSAAEERRLGTARQAARRRRDQTMRDGDAIATIARGEADAEAIARAQAGHRRMGTSAGGGAPSGAPASQRMPTPAAGRSRGQAEKTPPAWMYDEASAPSPCMKPARPFDHGFRRPSLGTSWVAGVDGPADVRRDHLESTGAAAQLRRSKNLLIPSTEAKFSIFVILWPPLYARRAA